MYKVTDMPEQKKHLKTFHDTGSHWFVSALY